jgi:hypothetical protein
MITFVNPSPRQRYAVVARPAAKTFLSALAKGPKSCDFDYRKVVWCHPRSGFALYSAAAAW